MKKVLMIAGDFTEDYEVMVPFQALESLGIKVDVVCPDKMAGDKIKTAIHDFEGDQTYTEKGGHNFTLNASFHVLKLDLYDGLYITGGRAPEYLRLDKRVLDMIKFFMELNKPIAAICHGIQILTAADVVRGRRMTAYSAVSPEIIMAGGIYVPAQPEATVRDGNLATSPAWPGNTSLLKEFYNMIGIEIKP